MRRKKISSSARQSSLKTPKQNKADRHTCDIIFGTSPLQARRECILERGTGTGAVGIDRRGTPSNDSSLGHTLQLWTQKKSSQSVSDWYGILSTQGRTGRHTRQGLASSIESVVSATAQDKKAARGKKIVSFILRSRLDCIFLSRSEVRYDWIDRWMMRDSRIGCRGWKTGDPQGQFINRRSIYAGIGGVVHSWGYRYPGVNKVGVEGIVGMRFCWNVTSTW